MFTHLDIASIERELSTLKPCRIDEMLRNDKVPFSNDSSMPSLLLTKSTSAIEAATVPVNNLQSESEGFDAT